MMGLRRRLLLTVCLLLIACAACQGAPASVDAVLAPTAAPAPAPTAAPTPAPTAAPTPEPTLAPIDEGWDDFAPQVGTPLPRPGDTLDTWDLSRADAFPADKDCTAEQLLEKWMTVEGITFADLDARSCTQLVLVAAMDGFPFNTTTVCYGKQTDGVWRQAEGLNRMQGTCGKSGVNHNRVQGDMSSPGGLWKIGTAFGNEEMPEGTKMPWRDITPYSDWVGDNDSVYYNTWQESNDPNLLEAYDGGEHLEDYQSAYAYACVIRFNMPPYAERYKGSAIFFHCSRGSTAGCIGLNKVYFVPVLLWLDPAQNPHILITGYGK